MDDIDKVVAAGGFPLSRQRPRRASLFTRTTRPRRASRCRPLHELTWSGEGQIIVGTVTILCVPQGAPYFPTSGACQQTRFALNCGRILSLLPLPLVAATAAVAASVIAVFVTVVVAVAVTVTVVAVCLLPALPRLLASKSCTRDWWQKLVVAPRRLWWMHCQRRCAAQR